MSTLKLSLLATAVAIATLATPAMADIKIGLIGPHTGGSASFGVSARDGAKLAIAEINAAGGIKGEKLVAVERDDEAKPERGPLLVQELIAEKVVAITGFTNYGVALPSVKVANDAKMPLIINVSAGKNLTHTTAVTKDSDSGSMNYIFRVTGHDGFQSQRMENYVVKRFGKRVKVAVMGDTTAYGQGGSTDLIAAFAADGVKPVLVEKFNLKDTDMTAQVLRAKKAGAQAITVYGIGPEIAALSKTMKKMGYNVPLVSSWGGGLESFVKLAGAETAEGVMVPLTFIQNNASTAKQKKFVADYKAAYKVDQIPLAAAAAQGYDTIYLLAEAIKQGGTESSSIVQNLENLRGSITGVVGNYSTPFSATNHDALKYEQVKMAVWKKGQLELAK